MGAGPGSHAELADGTPEAGYGSLAAGDEWTPEWSQGSPHAPEGAWGPAGDGCWLWAVDAAAWEPSGGTVGAEFSFLLSLLPQGWEREGVLKYPSLRDSKRCLLGRLLARRACARALGRPDLEGFEVGRTRGQKPFLKRPLPPGLPNFNFNISHDGRWVVFASHPLRLVGIDISAPQRMRGDPEDDSWQDDLRSLLFNKEQAYISQAATVRERYAIFQRIWSAKEAVTKAIGEGVDFDFGRIEVTLDGTDPPNAWEWGQWPGLLGGGEQVSGGSQVRGWGREKAAPRAEVAIDMWPRSEWELRQLVLPEDHWVTVALGPVEEAVDHNGEFSETFRLPTHQRGCFASPVTALRFEMLPITALVPPAMEEAFAALTPSICSLPA